MTTVKIIIEEHPEMSCPDVDSIVERVKALRPEDQVAVAEAIDRLTWAQRWRNACERIEAHRRSSPEVSDEQIDEMVRDVRREKLLSGRS